jgi:hypothetical protein
MGKHFHNIRKLTIYSAVIPAVSISIAFAQTSKITKSGTGAPPKAKSLTVGNVLEREMKVSEALSDHYRAYRLGLVMRSKSPDEFAKTGVIPFLESFGQIATVQDIDKQCEKLSSTNSLLAKSLVYLTCGRVMLEVFDLGRAQKYFEKIHPKSPHAVVGSVYLSSLYLGRGDGERCIGILTNDLRKRIKNPALRDLYHMTRARCFLEVNKFDQAVLEYQLISPTSQYYYDSLEETAWAQFRTRRLESARTLLDVIITTYETGLGQNRSVSPAMYFRIRYLQAYIELIENNVQKATGQFEALEQAISVYIKPKIEQLAKARDIAKKIASENSKWIDMKAMPEDVRTFLETSSDWTDSASRKRIERLIGLQFSLTRELARLQSEKDFSGYVAAVRSLEITNAKNLEAELVSAARATAKAMRVLKIKSDLGRIEIKWVERTQGVRSIDELLESYKGEVDEVEDHFNL